MDDGGFKFQKVDRQFTNRVTRFHKMLYTYNIYVLIFELKNISYFPYIHS